MLDALQAQVERLCVGGGSDATICNDRHVYHLRHCVAALGRVRAEGADVVSVAEELREAAEQLGHITGKLQVDEVLDVLFRDFCIGK